MSTCLMRVSAILLVVMPCLPFAVFGQENFALHGQAHTTEFPGGGWDGKVSFPSVYCVSFPDAGTAKNFRTAFFSGGAVYLVDAFYSNQMTVAIAVSTIPSSQSSAVAMAKIQQNEKRNAEQAAAAGYGYTVTQLSTDFGPTVGLVARNISPGDSTRPFPLTRGFINAPKGTLATVSVHRLFVRGSNRFEIGVFQPAARPVTASSEGEMIARLSGVADRTMASLQECTASMPIRQLKNAAAAAETSTASGAHDSVASYLGYLNFKVGRLGRDCLSVLDRTETPQEFVTAWHGRNRVYLAAAQTYMQLRLDEIKASAGQQAHDAMLHEITSAAAQSATDEVNSMLARGSNAEACKRALLSIESKEMDVTPQAPRFAEFEAMRRWAERQLDVVP
jgi:hypothetical protein